MVLHKVQAIEKIPEREEGGREKTEEKKKLSYLNYGIYTTQEIDVGYTLTFCLWKLKKKGNRSNMESDLFFPITLPLKKKIILFKELFHSNNQ